MFQLPLRARVDPPTAVWPSFMSHLSCSNNAHNYYPLSTPLCYSQLLNIYPLFPRPFVPFDLLYAVLPFRVHLCSSILRTAKSLNVPSLHHSNVGLVTRSIPQLSPLVNYGRQPTTTPDDRKPDFLGINIVMRALGSPKHERWLRSYGSLFPQD